jgi:hypothetical protein
LLKILSKKPIHVAVTNEHDVPKVTRQHAKLTSQSVRTAPHFLLGFFRLCQAKEPKSACDHGESRWPMQNRPNDPRRQRNFTRIDDDFSFGDEIEGIGRFCRALGGTCH